MTYLLTLLISAILTECLAFVDGLLDNLMSISLRAETYMTTLLGTNGFTKVFDIFLGVGISLIVLKFLKKGFEQYVLWTEGDPDADPIILLTGFFKALAVAICFPTMYTWLATVIEDLTNQVTDAIGMSMTSFAIIVEGVKSSGLLSLIMLLIFFVCFFALYIQFLTKGLEILILRIGLPLACVGLMDSDKGVFRTYIQKFFQSTIAILVQVTLAKLGLALMLNGHTFWGIATMTLAVKTPKFLQEFLITSGGQGGGTGNLYQTVRLAQMAKGVFKR